MSSSPPAPGMEDMDVEVETVHGEAPRPLPTAETGTGAVVGSPAANHTETAPSTHDHEEERDDGVDYSNSTQSAELAAAVDALRREVVNVEEKPSAGNTCSVCMEPWTCEGLHRICCIPCGHVYGRSCLEKWLQENAKCPQCKLQFEDKLIINLYMPANFGDGCGTVQEVKVYVSKAMAAVAVGAEPLP
ncbi:E3 ubiquitin-protein ligase RFWD3-like [Triticum aestivum]|uniref:E3 ubiquitin-protein ligase RFWD3-like n=1 Tax=Triticum aestivum TaxID=4565 RepID=UPI001D032C4A|nr:E3 ubiquitin-protein ligase RFWD3-like [Triticum aestivum]